MHQNVVHPYFMHCTLMNLGQQSYQESRLLRYAAVLLVWSCWDSLTIARTDRHRQYNGMVRNLNIGREQKIVNEDNKNVRALWVRQQQASVRYGHHNYYKRKKPHQCFWLSLPVSDMWMCVWLFYSSLGSFHSPSSYKFAKFKQFIFRSYFFWCRN